MNRTYEEILESMKNAYFSECKCTVDANSQTMKRFEILSSELFSISCYGDYIFKQAFVQTAAGENLDKLGELRGCRRKTASNASGELTFAISQISDTDIMIPKNTVCSLAQKPYIQFATNENAVLKAGELSVTVGADALDSGEAYNAYSNTVTVMVNAPIGVERVTNTDAFSGGCSDEADLSYRERILKHYSILPNGINCTSYENLVLTLDYITDCKIIPASPDNCMIVCVTTKNGSITEMQREEVADRIPIIDAAAIPYELKLAEKNSVAVKANACIMTGFDSNVIKSEIENAVSAVFSASKIGASVSVNRLKQAVSHIEGLCDCSFYLSDTVIDELYPAPCGILELASLEVSCTYD